NIQMIPQRPVQLFQRKEGLVAQRSIYLVISVTHKGFDQTFILWAPRSSRQDSCVVVPGKIIEGFIDLRLILVGLSYSRFKAVGHDSSGNSFKEVQSALIGAYKVLFFLGWYRFNISLLAGSKHTNKHFALYNFASGGVNIA